MACGPPHPTRPSPIILVVVDTLRIDYLSAYGSSVPTPNIDRLAASGQVFTNAVASFHQTSMSMGALFTGRTPSIESRGGREPLHWNGRNWCGLARLAPIEGEDACIPRQIETLGEAMKRAGYQTAGVVTNHFLFRPAGFHRGFDQWVEVGPIPEDREELTVTDPSMHTAAHVNRAALEILDETSAEKLFLYLHYLDVHDYPFIGRSYREAVMTFDTAFGSLLDSLEDRDLLRGAQLIFTSDHGEALGERHAFKGGRQHMGNPSFEPVLRVPLIVSPPLVEDPSRFLRSEDLFDLIVGLVAIPEKDPRERRELEPDELYLSELKFQTYRRERWKLVRRREDGKLWLFDLTNDPGEKRDVAAMHPAIVESLERRIDELAQRLGAEGDREEVLSPEDLGRLRALGYAE
jgi:arylsulfatase A-like enzyme